jgi:hypothetical protein
MKLLFLLITITLFSCGSITDDKKEVVNTSENFEIDSLRSSNSIIDKSVIKIFDNGFHKLPDTIAKLNENQFLIIDSVPDKGLFIQVSNADIKPIEIEYFYKGLYLIEELKGVALENVLYAFVYFTNFDECPSSTFQTLYIVTNSEIKEIASIHKEADEERDENEPYIEEEKTIYFPSFINNTILFKEVGFFQDVSPEVENTKRIFSDRIKINEPPQNLYIVEHLRIKEDSDTISRKVEFYNWNGYKSTLIKK